VVSVDELRPQPGGVRCESGDAGEAVVELGDVDDDGARPGCSGECCVEGVVSRDGARTQTSLARKVTEIVDAVFIDKCRQSPHDRCVVLVAGCVLGGLFGFDEAVGDVVFQNPVPAR
jgi:hypothetical protein